VSLEIRPIGADELVPFVTMLEATAGRRVSDEAVEDARSSYELDRTLAVFEGDTVVAGTGSDVLELTVPGPAAVAVARITHTGVLPTHRRRGVVTELWLRQIRDLRRRGEPLAVFTTTGPGIYRRRLGYSPATMAMEVEIETAHGALDVISHQSGRLRVLAGDDMATVLPDVFDRHRRLQPGQVSRPAAFWEVWLLDRARYRRGQASERFTVVFEGAAAAEGYLTYRLVYGPPRDQPVHALAVEDLVAVTDEARRALWAYCLSFHQAVLVTSSNVPVDEPLTAMLADPRRLRVTRLREFLWLRLLDVPVALSARRYALTDALVFDVADSGSPENQGRYRLETGPGAAACVRTTSAPDLALGVADLSAAYLGGVTFTTLRRAGRAAELTPGAAERADAVFASRPAPWTVTDW
jgi:predicted acetyltransferase